MITFCAEAIFVTQRVEMYQMNQENASELAAIAREAGAEVIEGTVSYPSDTGGWLIGDLDF